MHAYAFPGIRKAKKSVRPRVDRRRWTDQDEQQVGCEKIREATGNKLKREECQGAAGCGCLSESRSFCDERKQWSSQKGLSLFGWSVRPRRPLSRRHLTLCPDSSPTWENSPPNQVTGRVGQLSSTIPKIARRGYSWKKEKGDVALGGFFLYNPGTTRPITIRSMAQQGVRYVRGPHSAINISNGSGVSVSPPSASSR